MSTRRNPSAAQDASQHNANAFGVPAIVVVVRWLHGIVGTWGLITIIASFFSTEAVFTGLPLPLVVLIPLYCKRKEYFQAGRLLVLLETAGAGLGGFIILILGPPMTYRVPPLFEVTSVGVWVGMMLLAVIFVIIGAIYRHRSSDSDVRSFFKASVPVRQL